MMHVSANVTVVITLQYLSVSNQHVLCLKHTLGYLSIIFKQSWGENSCFEHYANIT